jgi:hypothetical protein
MMLRIPSNCRWKDSIALSGSRTLHRVAELIAFSSYRRMPLLAPIEAASGMEPSSMDIK